MQKILAYILSPFYLFGFGLTLVVFHGILWLSHNLFGYSGLIKAVNALQFCLMRCLIILGTRFSIDNPYTIKTDKPLIIISNHQSMQDIPPIIWYFRKHHPKFISKIELGKGIPSVSYNLRHGGSALIDRKNPRQAIIAIKNFSNYINTTKHSAVIFPEGTRSRNGKPKPFQKKGLLTLFESIPDAIVVPLTINNSWKTQQYGKFPMGIGAHITLKIHKPIPLTSVQDKTEFINNIETTIKNSIH